MKKNRYINTSKTAKMMGMSVENLRLLAKDSDMKEKGFPSFKVVGKRNWKFSEGEVKDYLIKIRR